MRKELIVLKLGGSIITDKNNAAPTLLIDNIRRLALDLFKVCPQYRLLIIHGAGSYGHPIVKRYDLHKGMHTIEQKIAFSKTQQLMLDLNKSITQELHNLGIPTITVSPHCITSQKAGKFIPFSTSLIKNILNDDIIPVLYGDIVLDPDFGCSILSGDVLVAYLATKLRASKIIFLTDVDGIYNSNPKHTPKANLITDITSDNIDQVLHSMEQHNNNDVTGEMKGKVQAIQMSIKNIPTYVINGLKENTLIPLLEGDQVGTKLLFE